jgi:hypothetical protein
MHHLRQKKILVVDKTLLNNLKTKLKPHFKRIVRPFITTHIQTDLQFIRLFSGGLSNKEVLCGFVLSSAANENQQHCGTENSKNRICNILPQFRYSGSFHS